MNNETYNLAMFGKEYLDKAINGLMEATPKVIWYLEWKCHIFSILYTLSLISVIILSFLIRKIWIDYQKKIKDYSNIRDFEDYIIRDKGSILVVLGTITVFAIIALIIFLPEYIISFTPICVVDKAIEIGKNIIN